MIKSPRSVVAKSEVEVTAVDLRRGAMDLLARREHSRQELQFKLGRRFDVEPEIISRVVDQLAREGLQSNQRLAEAYLRYRSNRGQGPLKIKAELRGKAVENDLIDEAFNAANIDWFAQAVLVLHKRFGESPATDATQQAKRARFLQQRGFSFDQIYAVTS
jgi:regulatory protein